MTKREVMQMALDALSSNGRGYMYEDELEAIKALRAELAKPEPEPVAWITQGGKGELWWYRSVDEYGNNNKNDIPLYRKEDL